MSDFPIYVVYAHYGTVWLPIDWAMDSETAKQITQLCISEADYYNLKYLDCAHYMMDLERDQYVKRMHDRNYRLLSSSLLAPGDGRLSRVNYAPIYRWAEVHRPPTP